MLSEKLKETTRSAFPIPSAVKVWSKSLDRFAAISPTSTFCPKGVSTENVSPPEADASLSVDRIPLFAASAK